MAAPPSARRGPVSALTSILTFGSIASVLVGISILLVHFRGERRRSPTPPEPERPARADPSTSESRVPRPEAGVAGPQTGVAGPDGRSPAAARRRRRIGVALLLLLAATLVVAVVVRNRLALGAHLLADDAFLGFVAVLARQAQARARTLPLVQPEADTPR